jgi:hypothetical protein
LGHGQPASFSSAKKPVTPKEAKRPAWRRWLDRLRNLDVIDQPAKYHIHLAGDLLSLCIVFLSNEVVHHEMEATAQIAQGVCNFLGIKVWHGPLPSDFIDAGPGTYHGA